MNFASDNAGPVAPEAMDALMRANDGYSAAYGADVAMDLVTTQIRDIFEAPDAAVYLVATGTAANALSLATLAQPWDAIYCHRLAHVEIDECGAPEFFTGGAKLVLIDGADGKIDPQGLDDIIRQTASKQVHGVQRGPLSLTQSTDLGTAYTPAEISLLTSTARRYGSRCHMDGARLANAVAALECSPADVTWKAGVDIASLGGTKNGLMGVEAVVIFDHEMAWQFELRRKRSGHLFSKHRYLSAQMQAALHDGLWLKLAHQANQAARRLSAGIEALDGASLFAPSDTNMVFCTWRRDMDRRARAAGATYYYWPFDHVTDGPDDECLTVRLVCNWATTMVEVDALLSQLAG